MTLDAHNMPIVTMPRFRRGFSLLEVLIALLIFSLGLLGMAGLTVLSIKTNHSAYLRTQASFLAEAMSDRMRANIAGVWSGAYDGSYPKGVTAPNCNSGAGCSPTEVALRDQDAFNKQLSQLLPNASADIACTQAGGAASAADLLRRRPYNGTCLMTVTWSESQLQVGTDSTPYTLTWAFQP